jgi:hypothetical protein
VSAGKGDAARAVRGDIYRANFDAIFAKKNIASPATFDDSCQQMTHEPSTPAQAVTDGHEPRN